MENKKVSESLQFLVFCREALAQIIDVSSMDSHTKKNTKNFLYNEASDYQIMSLIVRSEMTEDKYNILDEVMLFEELKAQMILATNVISEFMTVDDVCDFIHEVDTVTTHGISSARPILEFMTESYASNSIVSEELTPTDVVKWTRTLSKSVGDKLKDAPEVAKAALVAAGKKYDDSKEAIAAAAKTVANRAKVGWAKFVQDTDPQLNKMRAQKGNLGAGTGDMSASQSGALKATIQKSADAAKDKQAGMSVGDKAGEAMQQYINRMKFKYPNAATAVQDMIKKTSDFAQSGQGKAVGAAALLALISYASYKVYKAKFSAAAKSCKGKKGPEKKQCMSQFKKQALMAQAADMQKASAGCGKTKDPAKCKAAINAKIMKLKAKAAR